MGVKETKEVLVMGFAIAGIIKGELSDGFQPNDLLEALGKLASEENVKIIQTALEGASEVPSELQGAGLFEGIELGRFVLAEVKKLFASI